MRLPQSTATNSLTASCDCITSLFDSLSSSKGKNKPEILNSAEDLDTACLSRCAGSSYYSCSYCNDDLSCWRDCLKSETATECVSKCPGIRNS